MPDLYLTRRAHLHRLRRPACGEFGFRAAVSWAIFCMAPANL